MLNTSTSDTKVVNEIIHAVGIPSETVYSPSEDSFLMLQALCNIELNDLEVCDIGTGSGVLGLFCSSRGAKVTVTDVNEIALHETMITSKRLGIKVKPLLSNLFANVKGRFDLILFNPPYLPCEVVLDRAVDGERNGLALTRRFLEDLPSHLKTDGHGFLLLSSLNNPEKVVNEHTEYSFRILATKRIFFEELQVLDLRLRENLAGKRLDR